MKTFTVFLLIILFAFVICTENYYSLLGVSTNFTKLELKKAYEEKLKQSTNEKERIRMNKAFEVLSDKEFKNTYDNYKDFNVPEDKLMLLLYGSAGLTTVCFLCCGLFCGIGVLCCCGCFYKWSGPALEWMKPSLIVLSNAVLLMLIKVIKENIVVIIISIVISLLIVGFFIKIMYDSYLNKNKIE